MLQGGWWAEHPCLARAAAPSLAPLAESFRRGESCRQGLWEEQEF